MIILFSAVAGILGMGIGGLISAILLKRPSENITCWMLSFAAGIMASIVCFGLLPEAIELSNIGISIFGLVLGVITLLVLNRLVDKKTATKESDLNVHITPGEIYHESQFVRGNSKLLRSGFIILVAIGLHNIPEGIAIGASGSHDYRLGALLAMMIMMHNVPEGMAIAAPLLAGGIKKTKVVLLTAICGSTTLIGGLLGVLIGGISEIAVAISLAAAGGAMLYVVFGEIIPQSVVMTKNRAATLITLLGIIVGLIITQV